MTKINSTDGEPQVMQLRAAATAHVGVPWAPGKDTAWGLAIDDDDVVVALSGARGAKLSSVDAVLGADDAWVLRRSVATEMFEGVDGVELRTARVVQDGKPVRGEFVFVDVIADRLLDRDRATATYTDPARPWSSLVLDVDAVHVLGLAPDRLALARVTEFPSVFVASAPVVARWRKLRAPVDVVAAPHGHRAGQPVFPFWTGKPPAFPKLADARPVAMAAAVAAFRKLLAGNTAARGHAIDHPWLAYGVARLVDRGPKADTRKAALQHPCTATLYARFVDHTPRNDTRTAAARWVTTATFYAEHVDRGLREPIRHALAKELDNADLATLEATLGHSRDHTVR